MELRPQTPVESGELDFDAIRAELRDWTTLWFRPIVDHTYGRRLTQAQLALSAARAALAQSALSPDAVETVGYLLDFSECQIRFAPVDQPWTVDDYLLLKARFSRPATSRFAELERLRRWLTIRCNADLDGFEDLSQTEIEQTLDRLPEEWADSSVWHHIASWAFRRRNQPLLERAYENQLINPSFTLGQARWQRVNLMYLLVAGKATARDVAETIKTLEIKPQLHEFQAVLWPRCVEAGLTDDDLAQQLATKAEEVERNARGLRDERKTKSVRSGSLLPDP